MKKKVFAVFMIVAMLLCFMPSMAFAEGGGNGTTATPDSSAGQIGDYYEVKDATGTLNATPTLKSGKTQQSYADGQVLVNKTISATNTENVFDVNLEVKTTEEIEKLSSSPDAATVIVMDVSGSMENRLDSTKKAAQTFINQFASDKATRKIAIVKFSGYKDQEDQKNSDGAATVQGWTEANNLKKDGKDQLCDPIKNLEANGGTNIEAGLTLAKNLLNSNEVKDIENKNIILLTDGNPTYHIDGKEKNSTSTTVICKNGTSIGGDGKFTQCDDHKSAEKLAKNLKQSGIGMYAIYIGTVQVNCKTCRLNTSGKNWLSKNCGFTAYSTEKLDQLTDIFKTILTLIEKKAEAWIVTDPMGTNIEFVGFSREPNPENEFDENDGTITWDIKAGSIPTIETKNNITTYTYSLSYTIKLNTLENGFYADTFYNTNDKTSLTYLVTSTKGDDTKITTGTAYFNIPSVKGFAGNLEFTKVDENGNPLSGATFTLTADEDSTFVLTAVSDGDGKVSFNNIPSGHTYTMEETEAPTGYVKAEQTMEIAVAYGIVSSAIVSGTFANTPETITVPVQKVWDDRDNQDGLRPDYIIVELLKNEKETGNKITLTASENWAGEFTGLKKYEDGQIVTYSVKEASVPGYISVVNENVTTSGFTITNTHEPATTSVSGSKTWLDTGNSEHRPDSITVRLKADGVEKAFKVVSEDENGIWGWSFDNLPKYNKGNEIRYTITEDSVKDYTATISGYDITNTYTPGVTGVSVSKVWNDNNDQDDIRPDSVTVQLYADREAIEGKTLELSEANNWSGTFTDLPVTNGQGATITYSVEEVVDEALDGYTPSISGSAATGFTITNTHTPATTSVSGSKTWDDNNDQDRKRPEKIKINLYKSDSDGLVPVASKTVTAADGWAWSFTNLPEKENGKIIDYRILEEPVEYYTSEVDGYDVINSYTPDQTSVSVNKSWQDNENKDGIRPDSVTVQLYADGKVVEGKTVTLTGETQWTGTFTGLPKYDAGREIVYSVAETEVPNGYTASVAYNDVTGSFVITNSHAPEEENPIDPTTYTTVSVNKVWKLDDGGKATDSVSVQLYRNGQKYGNPVTLSTANNWAHTWTVVYYYSDVWTVEEINVPQGFAATVSKEDNSNRFTVVNDDIAAEIPIEDPDVPLGPGEVDEPEEPVVIVDEPEVPLDDAPATDVPKTGDNGFGTAGILFFLSAAGLAALAVTGRKKEEAEK
ncbi:MAG: Cna B-type domain-containing protein [Firmicutes bacterium]|nr:Cna B-type domain-containing protein [Bacillota bacterium]